MEEQTNQTSGWNYKATLPRRFLAVLIDALILIPVEIIANLIFPKLLGSTLGGFISGYLIPFGYTVYFIGKDGATIGKKIMKVKVVRVDGKKLTYIQAFLREVVGKFISALVFGLGYILAAWDKDRRTWHDKIAGSVVVTTVPNDGKNPLWIKILAILLGFTPVIAIIAAVVVLIINPLELTKRARDSVRISDLVIVNGAIVGKVNEDTSAICNGRDEGCEGVSNMDNASLVDGNGWVKVDLSQANFMENKLPVDPVNNASNVYRFCSDGENWELNTMLESKELGVKANEDNGDDPNIFEVGSSLTICK